MSMTSSRLAVLFVGLASVASALADLPADGSFRHEGVASCAASQCHGSAAPTAGSSVLQNEYVTWTRDDPHSGAYATLLSAESKAIAARLGIPAAENADVCLDCHADNVPAGRRGERFQISDGVGCEACHGGSENWLATHDDSSSVMHADNLRAGLYPTERPVERAALCLSCHLGTNDKFATHGLMAAGHPRLVFELDTFTELWRTAGRQPHYRVDDDYRERKESFGHVQIWATGVIAEARRRLALIRGPVLDADGLFPELGLYDCHACHRTMNSVRWRRLPRHGNAGPGVPFLTDGALVLSLALARAVDDGLAESVEAGLAALHEANSASAEALKVAAAALDDELALLGRRIDGRLEGRERQLLREILATGAEGNYLDYSSAEQAFMAVQMLVFEIGDTALEERLDALGDSLDDDEAYRPQRFADLLARLGG